MKFITGLLLLPAALFAAGRIVTFSAVNPVTYERIALDSVRIENLSCGCDTTLTGTPVFGLDDWTGIAEKAMMPGRFAVSANYPNGFATATTFALAAPHSGRIAIKLFNILGQKVADQDFSLPAGWHRFTLHGGALANGLYLLRISYGAEQQVIKMIKIGSVTHGRTEIAYLGAGTPPAAVVLARPSTEELYRFTGYAGGFMPATVEREVQASLALQFAMLPPRPADDLTSGWRGFNLMGMFTLEWDHSGYVEEDFRMIAEFGFTFVRLPIDYRIYTKTGDWNTFLAPKLALIDSAVAWGERYGIHVCINLHRAPGYCVNAPSSPLPAAQNVSLWDNAGARQAFASHWRMFAERYRIVPAGALSFNLVNEPGNVSAEAYVQAMQPAIAAIRAVTPDRIIISDAVDYGSGRIDAILGENVVISPHFYAPFTLTHFKADWVDGSDAWPVPSWPPDMVSGYFYGAGKSPWNTPLTITGTFPVGTRVTLHVVQVSASADFQVSAGTQVVYRHDFRPAAGSGEWQEVIYRPEWNIYQNIYNRDYSFTLTRQTDALTLRVLAGDWMTWSELRLEPPAGSGLPMAVIQPGIADWGVPQGSYALQPDGSLLLTRAPAGYADKFRVNGFLQQWVDLKRSGVPVHVGEWGVYNRTPHEVTLAFMENRLLAMQSAGLGWALWNFRGSFGIMDSGREDVAYESFRGHKLDRKMLELLQRYK
jgi:aryl-phospho-beta-D-glucosidase BglC (GH1 family)